MNTAYVVMEYQTSVCGCDTMERPREWYASKSYAELRARELTDKHSSFYVKEQVFDNVMFSVVNAGTHKVVETFQSIFDAETYVKTHRQVDPVTALYIDAMPYHPTGAKIEMVKTVKVVDPARAKPNKEQSDEDIYHNDYEDEEIPF